MKNCNKCKLKQEYSEFHKSNHSKDGYVGTCKICKSKIRKQQYIDNKEKYNLSSKQYYHKNKEKLSNIKKQDRIDNPDKYKERSKNYFIHNKDKIYNYTKNKRMVDINYRLRANLRSRVYELIQTKYKTSSSVRDLGCSIDKLKLWLEMHFQDGMSWDNYGQYGWHIDHIMPLASFDLTDKTQFLQAVHFTNLQPLWWRENLSKSDKIL